MSTPPFRTRQFHIRLTDEEREQMHRRAKDAGYKLSGFVRECGMNGKVRPVPAINFDQWSVLAATTANLNQLVRLCHKGTVPENLDSTILETARLLRDVRSRLIREK
jgi:hypothetical protein